MTEKVINEFLLSYDTGKKVFSHVSVLAGNVAQGTFPIYHLEPLKGLEDVCMRIMAAHVNVSKKGYTPGKSNIADVFAEYRAKGGWFTADEMREYLKSQVKNGNTKEAV